MNTEQLKQAALAATPGPRFLADHGDYGDYDGMVTEPKTKEELAEVLTRNEYLPEKLLPVGAI